MSRFLMSGNEAVARGAWEAGVAVGVGYPGTPSTQALERLAEYSDVRAEWAPNEKVALEVAFGVSLGGRRSLVTMKHVGLNVASDPLFTIAYTGVGGGLVVFVADDPGMHSSQNEQDTRNYAVAAMVPLLEPSDPGEALAFTKEAFRISEEYDVPVIVRSLTRLSHGKGMVDVGERVEHDLGPYKKSAPKNVMMPGFARPRRVDLDLRMQKLAKESEKSALNVEEIRDPSVGIVTAGIAYEHVREALPDASVFKLGMVHPLPVERLKEFAEKVDDLYVVEELSPYLKSRLRLAGIRVEDSSMSYVGEMTANDVRSAFGVAVPQTVHEPLGDLPPRPPVLCAGCGHRGVFWGLRKMKAAVMGDIGCYTLATLAPLQAMDSCLCMGASIGMAHGLDISGGAEDRPVVGVIGDSTFAHTGLHGLLNTAYNKGNSAVVILDNRITAMTGHQENPVTGRTLQGSETFELDLVEVSRALGATHVVTVNPHDLAATEAAMREAVAHDGLAVVVAKAQCALTLKDFSEPFAVDAEACTACKVCVRLGCPAISVDEEDKAVIDVSLCVGCEQCVAVCRFEAILPAAPVCEVR